MEFSDIYATAANSHIDSLVDYVLDVKPYHTKLSEIVEEFLFEDSLNVVMTDAHKSMTVMGLDYLNRSNSTNRAVWDGVVPRLASSLSAIRTISSDGTRKIFSIPPSAIPKFFSHSSQEHFTAGQDDYEIYGVSGFSQRRWDGSGITKVSVNDQIQCEGVDYHISHGAFSFNTIGNSKWIETDIASSTFEKSGQLQYSDVMKSYGTIKNIVCTTFEEWTITCIDANLRTLLVSGSISGVIGTASFGAFTSLPLSFEFAAVLGENPLVPPAILVGDTFVLTPIAKITVNPLAAQETWTLIKTNPQALVARPVFTRGGTVFAGPNISIYARSLEWTPQSSWTLTFNSADQFTISSTVSGYSPVVVQLIDGCSYKDEHIAFTLIPDETGFMTGDKFEFQIKAPQNKFNYLVHGSISGWTAPAKIGQWYWNGSIGFKIPSLEYFAVKQSLVISTAVNGLTWTGISVAPDTASQRYLNNAAITAGINQITGASLDALSWSSDATSMAVLGQTHIVVGRGGKTAASNDGYSWTSTTSNITNDLLSITIVPSSSFVGQMSNLALVVGRNGQILTSDSGISWQSRASNTTASLKSLATGNSQLVAVGENGAIVRSSDSITWTPSIPVVTSTLNKVKFINGVFIAVGDNGTIITSGGGNLWNAKSSGTLARLNDITFGNGVYVAVGEGVTCTSTDLNTWQVISSLTFNAITFGGGLFVSVQTNRAQIANFTPLREVHSVAEPSVYTITFRTPISANNVADVSSATVQNNLYGVRPGLKLSSPNSSSYVWQDEFCKWQIGEAADGKYKNSEVINVYLTSYNSFSSRAGYDQLPYDTTLYDAQVSETRYATNFLQEYFPLSHSHGLVIFSSAIANGADIVIDKANFEHIGLRIGDGLSQISALGTSGGWVPLEFRFRDRGSSPAWFSDYANYVDAYLGSDPDVLAFTVKQIRHKTTNRPGTATLTFADTFFNKFLPAGQQFDIQFFQADSFAQTIRVKMSENVSSNIEIQNNQQISQPNLGAAFNEQLTILEATQGFGIVRVNAVYDFLQHSLPNGNGLYISQSAPEYIITHNLSEVRSVAVYPATGSIDIEPDFTPYFPIPTATSANSFSFTVPGGTAPFRIIVSGDLPPNVLTYEGDPVTYDGQYIYITPPSNILMYEGNPVTYNGEYIYLNPGAPVVLPPNILMYEGNPVTYNGEYIYLVLPSNILTVYGNPITYYGNYILVNI